MPHADLVFLYIPCADEAEARMIAQAAIEAKLAGCANILPGMKSIYRWEGKITESAEAVLILKTPAGKAGELEALVRKLHSYETPCIATLPVAAINADYYDWLLSEVRG